MCGYTHRHTAAIGGDWRSGEELSGGRVPSGAFSTAGLPCTATCTRLLICAYGVNTACSCGCCAAWASASPQLWYGHSLKSCRVLISFRVSTAAWALLS